MSHSSQSCEKNILQEIETCVCQESIIFPTLPSRVQGSALYIYIYIDVYVYLCIF